MTTKTTGFWLAGALLSFGAGALAGCGGPQMIQLKAGPEEDITETTSALVTGCAAVTETAEAHVGQLIGYSTSHRELEVDLIKFKVSNPSDTPCASVNISWKLTNDAHGTLLESYGLNHAIGAHKALYFYSDDVFDSRTWQPKVGYDEDVWTYRNGNLMKATYLPSYFVNTGQY